MKQSGLLIAAIAVSAVGNALPFFIWLPLLSCPSGTTIRPMLEGSETVVAILVTLALGFPVGTTLISSGRRNSGWLCVAFSITPLLVNWLVVNWITSVRQLNWAD